MVKVLQLTMIAYQIIILSIFLKDKLIEVMIIFDFESFLTWDLNIKSVLYSLIEEFRDFTVVFSILSVKFLPFFFIINMEFLELQAWLLKSLYAKLYRVIYLNS